MKRKHALMNSIKHRYQVFITPDIPVHGFDQLCFENYLQGCFNNVYIIAEVKQKNNVC